MNDIRIVKNYDWIILKELKEENLQDLKSNKQDLNYLAKEKVRLEKSILDTVEKIKNIENEIKLTEREGVLFQNIKKILNSKNDLEKKRILYIVFTPLTNTTIPKEIVNKIRTNKSEKILNQWTTTLFELISLPKKSEKLIEALGIELYTQLEQYLEENGYSFGYNLI